MTFKLMRIEWVDSQTTQGWHGADELDHELGVTYTIGMLVIDQPTHMIIAHSYDPATEEFNGAMTIPKVSIVKEYMVGVVECG